MPVPLKVLCDARRSLALLFPIWDEGTAAFLERENKSFNSYGPFENAQSLSLMDFEHWRDRLLELHEDIFLSPPLSWAQLWRDRRNPQQFWTFWVALAILILTVVSTVGIVVQAWASVVSLQRSP